MSYGSVATAVGGELQGWASVLDKWAMQQAFADEAQRQAGYRGQALGTFNAALPTFGSDYANTALQQGSAGRQAQYQAAQQTPLGFNSPTLSSASPVRDAAWLNLMGQARGNLGGYNDWALQQAVKNIQTQNALNQISNFAGGTASVFPFRMYQAQHSMDDLAMVGQAIASLGGAAGNWAQFNQGLPQQQLPNFAASAYSTGTGGPAATYFGTPQQYPGFGGQLAVG